LNVTGLVFAQLVTSAPSTDTFLGANESIYCICAVSAGPVHAELQKTGVRDFKGIGLYHRTAGAADGAGLYACGDSIHGCGGDGMLSGDQSVNRPFSEAHRHCEMHLYRSSRLYGGSRGGIDSDGLRDRLPHVPEGQENRSQSTAGGRRMIW